MAGISLPAQSCAIPGSLELSTYSLLTHSTTSCPWPGSAEDSLQEEGTSGPQEVEEPEEAKEETVDWFESFKEEDEEEEEEKEKKRPKS